MKPFVALIGLVWFAYLLGHSTVGAGAQTAASSSCPRPNADAATVSATAPLTPPLAAQQGISGDVVVIVSLDENSQVVSVKIDRTASPLLNNAALAAARSAIFRTRIVNCHPVADSYRFIVTFHSPPLPPSSSEMYFLGTWACRADDDAQVVKAFGAMPAGHSWMLLDSALSSSGVVTLSTHRYSEAGSSITVTELAVNHRFIGAAGGWSDGKLVFDGLTTDVTPVAGATPQPVSSRERLTYARIDAKHFVQTIETANAADSATWVPISRETCAKIATPPGS